MSSNGYLIDTHCWLWWHIEPDQLSESVFRLIENGDTKIFFSVVSAWEISIKFDLKKLELPLPPSRYVASRLAQSYMQILPIQLAHALKVGDLPPHHKDPFDRLLIAQAMEEKLIVITLDKQFDKYAVETVR